MSCKYKSKCPSYSGWCEGPKQDFSRCVEFLVTRCDTLEKELLLLRENGDICKKLKETELMCRDRRKKLEEIQTEALGYTE